MLGHTSMPSGLYRRGYRPLMFFKSSVQRNKRGPCGSPFTKPLTRPDHCRPLQTRARPRYRPRAVYDTAYVLIRAVH